MISTSCGKTSIQAPINITGPYTTGTCDFQFFYKPSKLKIINNGYTIQANYDPGSYITIDGARFELEQFHFHSPSENTVDGLSFAMEAHLVHSNANDNLVVIGLHFRSGGHNRVVNPVFENVPDNIGEERIVEGVMVDATFLLPPVRSYYHFAGSLTTPPRTEGVSWNVMTEVQTVSESSVDKLLEIFGGNNRPIQDNKGREITLVNCPACK